MKLRWQISIIALLALCFPLVAWLAFSQLNQTYQNNMVLAVEKQAQIIKHSIESFYESQGPLGVQGLVAQPLSEDSDIDGNFSEWSDLPWYEVDPNLKFKLGLYNRELWLMVWCQDNSQQLAVDGSKDQLVIFTGNEHGIKKYSIARQAEGLIHDSELSAYWHERSGGYQTELILPNTSLTRLGVAVFDYLNNSTMPVYHGHVVDDQIQLQPLFQKQNQWQTFLENIKPQDGHLALYDEQGRLLYQTTEAAKYIKDSDWLSQFLYQRIFDHNPNDSSHFYGQQLTHQLPFGTLKSTFVQAKAQITLMQTFLSSLGWVLLSALVLIVGFLLYAALLAWRIKKLQKGLQQTMDDRGGLHTELPLINSSDELGSLSRGLSELLSKINDYTAYLKQLGGRLSHEMKTPISIVHTSLENLQINHPDDPFVKRALNANNRLKFILNQLSALSRLKQAIADAEKRTINLTELINQLANGYQSNNSQITSHMVKESLYIDGVAELIAQMLDKLIHNAETHTTDTDPIILSLEKQKQHAQITVFNAGSTIDEAHKHQLFDSLASFRTHNSDTPHLGLGLYIAQLISDYHQAVIDAQNTSINGIHGVVFTVKIPLLTKS